MKQLFEGKRGLVCLPMATMVLFSLSANATAITGTVNISGSASVYAQTIDFFGNPAFGCSIPGAGSPGCFLTNAPLSGDFAALVPGQVGGVIQDLTGPPISGNISVPAWMAFVNGIVFDLTKVLAGGAVDCALVNTSAANVSCTPIILGEISPFTLTNSADGTNASVFFNVQVVAYVGSTATGFSNYVGAFNTPSAGKNIAGILADIGSGIPGSAAYSANFTGSPVVPEPASMALLGSGLVGLGLLSRRRRSRR